MNPDTTTIQDLVTETTLMELLDFASQVSLAFALAMLLLSLILLGIGYISKITS